MGNNQVVSVSGGHKKFIEIISSVDSPPLDSINHAKSIAHSSSQRLTKMFLKNQTISEKEFSKENESSGCNGMICAKSSRFDPQKGLNSTSVINGIPPIAGELIMASPSRVKPERRVTHPENQEEFVIHPIGFIGQPGEHEVDNEPDSFVNSPTITPRIPQTNPSCQQKSDNKENKKPEVKGKMSLNIFEVKQLPKMHLSSVTSNNNVFFKDDSWESKALKTKRKFKNGCVYEGDWDTITKRHGYGTFTWEDGSKYIGQWAFNKANGNGKYESKNGDVYEGNWVDDKACGFGTLTSDNGSVYAGEWKDDMQHGIGKETWPDGVVYEGEYMDGHKHGTGKQWFPNGAVYEGSFVNNTISGSGKFTTTTGKEFEGDWVDSKLEGFGTIKWTDGSIFRGTFKEGRREGQGESFMASGELVKSIYANNCVIYQLSQKVNDSDRDLEVQILPVSDLGERVSERPNFDMDQGKDGAEGMAVATN